MARAVEACAGGEEGGEHGDQEADQTEGRKGRSEMERRPSSQLNCGQIYKQY